MKNYLLISITLLSWVAYGGVVVDDTGKWDKSSLKVCWRTDNSVEISPYFERAFEPQNKSKLVSPPSWLREVIKNNITTEFTIERVGIEFVGWSTCKPKDVSEIQLLISGDVFEGPGKNADGLSSVGRAFDDKKKAIINPTPEAPYFIWIRGIDIHPEIPGLRNETELSENHEYLEEVRKISVHEFGHMAGLHHENYITMSKGRRVSPFDKDSVMAWGPRKTKLSNGDVQALRCLYKIQCPTN